MERKELIKKTMEWKEKKPKMSVPQFGGWEKKAPGVPTDYSMVFSQARANKKTQKDDLTEVKRISVGNERPPTNANHHRINPRTHPQLHAHAHGHGHPHAHGHAHAHVHQDPPIMRRKKLLTCVSWC